MAHILVTGGAGYIGSHTCVSLLQSGHDITIVDNLGNSSDVVLDRIRELSGKPVRFVRGDVRDSSVLGEAFSADIDAVIHFAGWKAVGESVAKPLEYYSNNLESTLRLCAGMKQAGVHRLVFSSSATVYKTPAAVPIREDAPLGATNPYGWTKVMGERILRDVAAAEPDWSMLLLRYFNPVGAHPSGRMGEDPAGIPNNLMPYITQVASGRLDKLTVFGDQYPTPDGTGVRDYIHVMDLAEGHGKAMDWVLDHTGVHAVNLGTGCGYSVLDVIRCFEETNQIKIAWETGPNRPGDVAENYADPSFAAELLDWRAQWDLADMCRDAWRWQQAHPEGYGSR